MKTVNCFILRNSQLGAVACLIARKQLLLRESLAVSAGAMFVVVGAWIYSKGFLLKRLKNPTPNSSFACVRLDC